MGMEVWDLWYPNAAAQGLSFCRGRMDRADVVLVHAAPDALRVEIRSDDGQLLAFADQLRRQGEYYPMTRLRRDGSRVLREDGWPVSQDLGQPVLLPGGEIGILKQWWNAANGTEWRWTIEFCHHV